MMGKGRILSCVGDCEAGGTRRRTQDGVVRGALYCAVLHCAVLREAVHAKKACCVHACAASPLLTAAVGPGVRLGAVLSDFCFYCLLA